MKLFLTFIENIESVVFEINEKDIFHLICDFIEKSSNILMTIVIIENPSQTFVYSNNIIMELVFIGSIV